MANNICSECNRNHEHQRTDYPQGSRVRVIDTFFGGIDTDNYFPLEQSNPPRFLIPAGSYGRVVGHCNDGRAIIEFDAEGRKIGGPHTFHHPEGYFELWERAPA